MNELLTLLSQAVADRITPTSGVSLSGGLDSSTVACLAPSSLPTFSGWYDVEGYSERRYAELVAHPEHHWVQITPQDFVDHFDDHAAALKPPYMGMGSFGQYMIARYASNHVDTLLSGEGSDELFGGYARQMIVAGEAPPDGYEDYQLPDDYPTDLAAALEYDWQRLPDLLAVDDQMTGAWGLRAVAPFMDDRVVAYAMALPPTERVGKRHLRERVRGLVPDEIIDRSDKMGFPIPLALWAQEEPVRSFVHDRIGRLPDPNTPWDRTWWYDLLG